MSDNKRCPFCNAEMKINHELMRYGSAVVHPDTDCVMVSLAFEIKGWNNRPIEERLETENAQLHAANVRLTRLLESTTAQASTYLNILHEYHKRENWSPSGTTWLRGKGWEPADTALRMGGRS